MGAMGSWRPGTIRVRRPALSRLASTRKFRVSTVHTLASPARADCAKEGSQGQVTLVVGPGNHSGDTQPIRSSCEISTL